MVSGERAEERGDALRGEALDALRACARSLGLEVARAARQGVLLRLWPASLDALPSADALRELADLLGGDGVRFVALVLDEPDEIDPHVEVTP